MNYLAIAVVLYFIPLLGKYIASQCQKEPKQGKKWFEKLRVLLLAAGLIVISWEISYYLLIFGLAVFLPLYYRVRKAAFSSLAGFLYVFASFQAQAHYMLSGILLLYGLVEGTLQFTEKKQWLAVLIGQLPFLVVTIVAWLAVISFK